VFCLLFQILLLYYFYPLSYFDGIHWSLHLKILTYCVAILILFVVTAVFTPLIIRLLRSKLARIMNAILGAILTQCIITVLSFVFGPYGLNIPGTQLRGMFFAEWNFLIFIFQIGPLSSILSGLAEYFRVYRDLK